MAKKLACRLELKKISALSLTYQFRLVSEARRNFDLLRTIFSKWSYSLFNGTGSVSDITNLISILKTGY